MEPAFCSRLRTFDGKGNRADFFRYFPEVESKQPGSHVGICVKQKNGRTDYILSSDGATHPCLMGNGMKASATYALWGNRQGEDCTLF